MHTHTHAHACTHTFADEFSDFKKLARCAPGSKTTYSHLLQIAEHYNVVLMHFIIVSCNSVN